VRPYVQTALLTLARSRNNGSVTSNLKLNPEQTRAVEHGEGPLLIIAGPGSGKTRVITQRIVRLLQHAPGLEPRNLLAVTFTDKAAAEMKERVRLALSDPPELPQISTFHAFCYEVLCQRHFDRILLDKVDLWIFLRRRMEQLGIEIYRKLVEPGAFLHDLNDFFARCQDELVEPEQFEDFVRQLERDFVERARAMDAAERKLEAEELLKKHELARVFRCSRELIDQAGASSLGSLISEAVHLFEREPDFRARYREQFRYILVDEFQDTNYGQVELLRHLVAPPDNITAVGDDDQAIYRFRGAAHGAFQMFAQAFPGHQRVYLNRNYRSTKRILRVVDVVIAQNDREENKPRLLTDADEGCPVYLLESPDYLSEAVWIADEVERLPQKEGTPLGQIAVLYRAHVHRDVLVDEFLRRRIPFAIRGLSILATVVARNLRAYLNVIHSPHDNISLTRVLLAPCWEFPEELAVKLRRHAGRVRCSLYEALLSWEQTSLNEELQRTRWGELKKMLRALQGAARHLSVTALFDRLLASLDVGVLASPRDLAYIEAFRKFLESWEKDPEKLRLLLRREMAAPRSGEDKPEKQPESRLVTLREFMEFLPQYLEAGGQIEPVAEPGAGQAVQMMTVHAAKGLEFPVVFILSVAPRRFPVNDRKPVIALPEALRQGPEPPSNIHTQEERRLFFVALTRARQRLYISSVTKPGKKPSKFVDDLLSNPAVRGRDIQMIHVAPVSPDQVPAGPPPPPEASTAGAEQGSVFGGGASLFRVFPPVAPWAAQQPSLEPNEKLRLSATAVEAYQDCPLKFKFSHFLKVPTGPQAALTFGNIMHQCVRYYFELRRTGVPTFKAIQGFFESAWKDVGFEDAYQEQAYKKAGLEQLRAFVERHNALPAPGDEISMEEDFACEVGDVTLEGRIDLVRPLQGDGAELIDYKTGRPRSQKDADESLQLSVYALAAREFLQLNPERLTFYNLTSNEPVSSARTLQDLEKLKQEIRAVAERIRQKLFPAQPGFACRYCDYPLICPAHEKMF